MPGKGKPGTTHISVFLVTEGPTIFQKCLCKEFTEKIGLKNVKRFFSLGTKADLLVV